MQHKKRPEIIQGVFGQQNTYKQKKQALKPKKRRFYIILKIFSQKRNLILVYERIPNYIYNIKLKRIRNLPKRTTT